MSPQPWEPDRPLTLEQARAVIMACFPEIDAQGAIHLGSGWDFDAFLTTDGWVFRFPRRAECAEVFESEQRIHQLISSVLPSSIAVPQVELMGQPALGFPYRFAGHRLIPGVDADAVGTDVNPNIAREIGTALGAIHSIPEEIVMAAGVVEVRVDHEAEKQWFERGMKVVPALGGLDPTVDEALQWVSGLSLPFDRFEGRLRFTHNDLSPDHVIVDSKTGKLAGIIDWSDAALGDPARDFVFLVTWRGWGFAEEVLRYYPHALDRDFRERLRFVARLMSLMWLTEAHERQGDVAKHIAWVRNASLAVL